MNHKPVVRRSIFALLAFGLALTLLGVVNYHAHAATSPVAPLALAQETTPTPAPEGEAGSDVTWTVGEITFESHYPQGFSFTAEISSSAGPIVRGRVIWSHKPGTQRSRPIEVDPETGLITATWETGVGESIPPWVGVTYYFDVGDEAGNSFQTEPLYAEYADDHHEWIRTESEDIIVFTTGLPEEVNQLTVDAMAAQRETYRTAWGDLLPYKPRAILFGDREAWNEWRIGASNPRVIGQTSDDWGGTVQVVSGGNYHDLAYGTVLHEVGHLYQAEFTFMPAGTWLIEGDATFFEISQQYDYEGRVRRMAAEGRLPALLHGPGPGVSDRLGYDIGYTFIKWLTDNYGLEAHREFIELLDQGVRRNDALEEVTGLSVDEIERRWRTWLGALAEPPTLIPTPTMFMFASPTPFGQ